MVGTPHEFQLKPLNFSNPPNFYFWIGPPEIQNGQSNGGPIEPKPFF